MAESPSNPSQPITTPDPLITEPEIVSPIEPDTALTPHPPPGRRAAATFIFFTVTLDMLALGMIAPVLPRLIEGFLHGDTSSAARMLGLFGTVFAAMQFFFSPILGSLSDRFGRRPVVLLSNFGLGFDYLLMAWAPALSWLFVGRVISGLTASSIPTAMAYMADVTPRERRAAAFGMLNAAFGIGFVLGPAMGGLLGNINPRLPFWVAGLLSLINGLYGLFVLPESLALTNRSPFSWARANPVGSLNLLKRGGMLAVSGVLLLGYIAQQSLMNVYVIYADYRYHWTDRTVGFSLATIGVFTAIYGALLVKRVVAKIGERGAITLGLIGGAIGYSMFGFSKTGLLFWLGIPLLNLMSFTWPSAQSVLSRKTSPSEQGQLQGAINSLRGIAGLIGPGFFTYVFSKSIGANAIVSIPGTPFYVAAAMLLIALALAQSATRPSPSKN
ncbi:TCR/Tet family MFS transporter [Tunturibacter empetritectus]|uniref:DHA1 family tetracycline resistance protein-like MFS transporter n=1 Tax=Tunturiibacter empetritectus TaxID=3069691 RepID=A0A7W8IJE0_9BACT|nr:TCR/Tet family MFS transporter [Edaphobacter lichenicola]MBB5317511.1 DHA1 family tetracycline resistance protein-like MFS transporter [Edaphobacter lichenicola]